MFQVTKVESPPSANDIRIDNQLQQQVENDILQQYLTALQGQIGLTINQRAVQQAVGANQVN